MPKASQTYILWFYMIGSSYRLCVCMYRSSGKQTNTNCIHPSVCLSVFSNWFLFYSNRLSVYKILKMKRLIHLYLFICLSNIHNIDGQKRFFHIPHIEANQYTFYSRIGFNFFYVKNINPNTYKRIRHISKRSLVLIKYWTSD